MVILAYHGKCWACACPIINLLGDNLPVEYKALVRARASQVSV